MPEETPNNGERESQTGTDEFFKSHSELTAANEKRTYDAYQDLDLSTARRSQLQFDQIQNIGLQALQNSVHCFRVLGGLDAVSLVNQKIANQPPDFGVVFHNQNGRPGRRHVGNVGQSNGVGKSSRRVVTNCYVASTNRQQTSCAVEIP